MILALRTAGLVDREVSEDWHKAFSRHACFDSRSKMLRLFFALMGGLASLVRRCYLRLMVVKRVVQVDGVVGIVGIVVVAVVVVAAVMVVILMVCQ